MSRRLRVMAVLLLMAMTTAAAYAQTDQDLPPAATPDTKAGSAAPATYAQDVAPVLHRSCVSCHNPSGGAPFSLTSYADAKQWGGQILDVTQSRYMPPWLPVPDLHGGPAAHEFSGERRLSDADLEAIRRWVSAGMPEGASLTAGHSEGTSLLKQTGRADLTLTPAISIHVPAAGPDIFLTFAIPVPDGAAHNVRAIGIEASDPQAAHSVFVGFDKKRVLRAQHPEVLSAGLPGMELSPEQTEQFAPGGQLLLWTPDAPVLTARPAWALTGGSDLILTAHVKTTGHAEDLTFKMLLYFAKAAGAGVTRPLLNLNQDAGLEIAAGDKGHVVEAQLTLKQATAIASIYPRAHYVARGLTVTAALPGGHERNLLTIEKWDTDWVSVYRFVHPLMLPKGTVVRMRFTYDNSSNNPHNPSDPPKKVVSGHGAKDEVAEVWMETGR